jgi:hypothetical protein
MNEDNLSNVRQEASRHFRNKKREYLKDKINELESNSKNKNIRDLYWGINEFKKGFQPRTNLLKNEMGDLLADPQKIVNRWMNYFCQLLNYRPISLLSLFKKMEKLMYNRLIAFVVRNGALTGSL